MCYTHPEYLFILSIGRPIANIFLCPLFSIVDSLESVYLVRLICVLLTSIAFFIINRFLIYLKFNKISSYFIVLIIVTSFPFQVYNSWIMASYIPIGIIFSIFSIFFAVKLIESIKRRENYLLDKEWVKARKLFHNSRFRLLYIFSIVFYILTLSTYQPSAGFFTCSAAIYMLREKGEKVANLRLNFIVIGSIFFISNFFYFLILRVLLLAFSYEDFIPLYDPRILESVFDPSFIVSKFIWFFKEPFLVLLSSVG